MRLIKIVLPATGRTLTVQDNCTKYRKLPLIDLRASSYEPGFRDLALPLNSFVKFSMSSYDRAGWLGSRDLGFFNRDLGKRAENFAGYRDESGMISNGPDGIVLHCLLYMIFHIISTPFNCSDTALRVTKAIIGAKVIIFVFRRVCFVFRISRQNSSPRSLAFFSARKPG